MALISTLLKVNTLFIMNQDLMKLIDIAAKSDIVTERQREIIRNKAISLGEDPEEAALYLDLLLKKKTVPKIEKSKSKVHSDKLESATDSEPQVVDGSKIQIVKTNNNGSKNRITAAILAGCLGTFGVHHFYLGRIGKGIACILFSWTFIPTIMGFVAGFRYLLEI